MTKLKKKRLPPVGVGGWRRPGTICHGIIRVRSMSSSGLLYANNNNNNMMIMTDRLRVMEVMPFQNHNNIIHILC